MLYNASLTSTIYEEPLLTMNVENLPLPVGDRSYTVNYIDENSRKNWNGTSEVITELPDIDDLKKHFEAKGNSSDESTLMRGNEK